MKSINIKSICKAAIAILPIVGLLASCEPTKHNTVGDKDPATANITVKVIDRSNGADVTGSATISATASSGTVAVSGNVVTVTGNKELAAQTITVNASTSAGSGSTGVAIPALAAACVYSGSVTVFVGTRPDNPPTPATLDAAQAVIKVMVIDRAQDNKEVTSESTISATSTGKDDMKVAGNIITITGNKALAAQTVTVKAVYKENEGTDSISIPAKNEGEFYGCALFIPVGKVTPPTPETKEAVATITVTVKDRANDDADVTADFTFKVESSCSDCDIVVDKNVITVTGHKAIDAQKLTVTASSISSDLVVSEEFDLIEVAANGKYEAGLDIFIGEPDVPGPGDVTTSYVEKKMVDVYTYGSMYFLPAATLTHDSHVKFDHNGHAYELYWIENDTEYIYEDYEDYTTYAGSYVFEFDKISDPNIKAIAALYNNGIKSGKETYHVQASAWSIWTLWAQVETVTTTYSVQKQTSQDGKVLSSEEIGRFDVITKNVIVTYEEAAHPGHAAMYHFGEGHAAHGAANNAGGGIVIAD